MQKTGSSAHSRALQSLGSGIQPHLTSMWAGQPRSQVWEHAETLCPTYCKYDMTLVTTIFDGAIRPTPPPRKHNPLSRSGRWLRVIHSAAPRQEECAQLTRTDTPWPRVRF